MEDKRNLNPLIGHFSRILHITQAREVCSNLASVVNRREQLPGYHPIALVFTPKCCLK
ncbi:230_t:CDS:2 [Gigaspora rosea]|nr:230_t:CDS:2 [Gigaspora rosea]